MNYKEINIQQNHLNKVNSEPTEYLDMHVRKIG